MTRLAVGLCVLIPLLGACGGASDDARVQFERARANLEAGDLQGASAHAERAAQLGGASYEALYTFVRGSVAFARSLALDDEVNKPDADPRARAGALAQAEDALAYWRAAAATRDDWPAARRNVERALLRMDTLREKGRQKRKKPPPPSKDDKPKPQEARIESNDLPPEQVMTLLDLLREKANQRRKARRELRRTASSRVERDW